MALYITPKNNISSSTQKNVNLVVVEDVPAFSFVTCKGNIANSNNSTHCCKNVGITLKAVNSNNVAQICYYGYVTNSNWNWPTDVPLFLNGTSISTTPPEYGWSQCIGCSISPQTIFISLREPVLL